MLKGKAKEVIHQRVTPPTRRGPHLETIDPWGICARTGIRRPRPRERPNRQDHAGS